MFLLTSLTQHPPAPSPLHTCPHLPHRKRHVPSSLEIVQSFIAAKKSPSLQVPNPPPHSSSPQQPFPLPHPHFFHIIFCTTSTSYHSVTLCKLPVPPRTCTTLGLPCP
ncbi:hypothetical protein EJ06DRAFT_37503 [Trichodelitschia bisporula]|uniref:Uncharacterized protein n=1 Tax=Trichodelitschia bisporula TaxID=703511 RepID=A0A6G1HVV3_9PEZI|nr:hypothetical protein EJ06DRAFT_37503 [Trichodelitschia bisporula]